MKIQILIITFIGLFNIFQLTYTEYYCTIYAHGIVDGPDQINRFSEAIITDNFTTITFPDTQAKTSWGINRLIGIISTLYGKPVNRSKMFMGQAQDIYTMKHQIIKKVSHPYKLILYGCSRGAATIINYVAQYNPGHVSALVLDATPCNMIQTIHNSLAQLGIHRSWDKSIFRSLFPAYPINAIPPINAIKHIQNKDLPILLLHSRTDSKVPFIHSLRLYLEFKEQGFNNVYFKDISHGKHSFLLQDPTVKNEYLKAVHSFYKKYNLPYNSDYAIENIKPYNYNFDQAREEIMSYEETLEEQYKFNSYRNAIIIVTAAILAAYKYS